MMKLIKQYMVSKKRIFVDTGAFMALADKKEPLHESAKSFFERAMNEGFTLSTSEYIVDELLTVLRCREKQPVEKVFAFITGIQAGSVEILAVTKPVFGNAMNIMKNFPDQYFSFTDCASFVLMKMMKIRRVVTTDKHFTIAGFDNLLD